MKFFYHQIELLKEYFNSTPAILIIFDLVIPVFSAVGIFYGYIHDDKIILLIVITLIVIFFVILIIRLKKRYIAVKNLYLNTDTFLADMIAIIAETHRLKEKENINNVLVKNLKVSFTIFPSVSSNPQSEMSVVWNLRCKSLSKELIGYHILCSKSESKKDFSPIATIKDFDNTYTASSTNLSNGLYNLMKYSFRDGNLASNTEFSINIILDNYYRFMWNDYEVLYVNAAQYGNSVESIKIKLVFKDSKIDNRIISLYIVNTSNFERKLINQSPCQLINGNYEYRFAYNKTICNGFFLIVIPKD